MKSCANRDCRRCHPELNSDRYVCTRCWLEVGLSGFPEPGHCWTHGLDLLDRTLPGFVLPERRPAVPVHVRLRRRLGGILRRAAVVAGLLPVCVPADRDAPLGLWLLGLVSLALYLARVHGRRLRRRAGPATGPATPAAPAR